MLYALIYQTDYSIDRHSTREKKRRKCMNTIVFTSIYSCTVNYRTIIIRV